MTMAYIIFVNPQIMAAAGMDKGTVMLATCLAAAAGTLLMALYANAPFGLAPGMGINAFFAYTLCGAMGYTWEQGLGAVLLSGIIFVVVSVTGLRSRIISEIPMHLKKAIGIGIGMFILYIGLKNASLLSFSANPGSFIPLGDSMKLDSSIIPALTFANDSAKLASGIGRDFSEYRFFTARDKRRDAAQYYYYFDVGLLSAVFQRLAVGAASARFDVYW